MNLALSPSEIRRLRTAIEIAIQSELDYIDCHFTDGRCSSPQVVRHTKANIRHLQQIDAKLVSFLAR